MSTYLLFGLPRSALARVLPVVLSVALYGAIPAAAQAPAQNLAAGQSQASPEAKPDDQEITFAIESRFVYETAVPWRQVDVSTSGGIVTLTGSVDNLLAKQRATLIAQTVRGVRSIVNNIVVQPESIRVNEEIQKDVEAALAADPATDAYEISTEVKDGSVTLTGKVQSFREKRLAEQVASGVRGVREVQEKLDVQFAKNNVRPDAEIAADIRSGLDWDAWLDASLIKVAVNGGEVALTGQVGSAAAKQRAEAKAWVSGVRTVDTDGLVVEPLLADKMRRPPGRKSRPDAEIARAVQDAFTRDSRIAATLPRIDVSRGLVMLSGPVHSLDAKRAAEQDARNTIGVWDVRNLLKVRPPAPIPDDQLAQNVKEALRRNPFVDKYQVAVTARQGVVTLKGGVESAFERATAEELASRIKGVVAVKNQLKLEEPALAYIRVPWAPNYYYDPYYRNLTVRPIKTDAQIQRGIQEQLRWSPWIDAGEVKVSVENGIATLTGKIGGWAEFNAAIENAFDGGAVAVRNQLKVE